MYFVLYIHEIVLKIKRAFVGGCAVGEIKRRKNIQTLHFDFMGTLDFSRKVKMSLYFDMVFVRGKIRQKGNI